VCVSVNKRMCVCVVSIGCVVSSGLMTSLSLLCNSSTWDFFFLILSLLHLLMCIHWIKNIRNKKDIVVLVDWGKYSYTERFLALLACTCVLQPTLLHLYQTSSLFLGPLPIVASASLRLLNSLLYREHLNRIQVSGFHSFPYSCSVHSPLSVWPTSKNITAFVLGL
jgi:hypothetical protein